MDDRVCAPLGGTLRDSRVNTCTEDYVHRECACVSRCRGHLCLIYFGREGDPD